MNRKQYWSPYIEKKIINVSWKNIDELKQKTT